MGMLGAVSSEYLGMHIRHLCEAAKGKAYHRSDAVYTADRAWLQPVPELELQAIRQAVHVYWHLAGAKPGTPTEHPRWASPTPPVR